MDGEDSWLVSSHLVSAQENIAPNSRRTPIARPGLVAYNYYSCIHSKPCYSLQCFLSGFPRWCPRRDLNPHVFRHYTLNVACLPIPSLGHIGGGSGTRTHTTSRSSDFESDMSTDSIIPPYVAVFKLVPQTRLKRISGVCSPTQQHHWRFSVYSSEPD